MTGELTLRRTVVGPVQTNCYTITCTATGSVLVIDPGDESALIRTTLSRVDSIVYTHGHFDHVGGACALIEEFSPGTCIHRDDGLMLGKAGAAAREWGFCICQPPPAGTLLQNGDMVRAGELCFTVMHSPGHSPGSICLLGHGLLFTGDTLFAGSIGRTDLPGSSDSSMTGSLKKLLSLPDDSVKVYPGHGPSTTLALEKRTNPFLHF